MKGDRRGGSCDRAVGGVSGKEEADAAAVVDGHKLTEDDKIEKFYALIRNYKEARERHRIAREEDDDDGEKKSKRRRTVESDRSVSSWIPAFEWEDFTEYSRIQLQRRSPAILPHSFSDVHRAGDRVRRRADTPPPSDADGGGLDLKLRL